MFEEERNYANRSFGFKVIAIHRDRMLVVKDDGKLVVLSHSLQTRIQENIEIQNNHTKGNKTGFTSGVKLISQIAGPLFFWVITANA